VEPQLGRILDNAAQLRDDEALYGCERRCRGNQHESPGEPW
jgi:hypothetical protein